MELPAIIRNVCHSVKAVKNIYVQNVRTNVGSVSKIIVRIVERLRTNAMFSDVMTARNLDMERSVLNVETMFVVNVLASAPKDVERFVDRVDIHVMDVKTFLHINVNYVNIRTDSAYYWHIPKTNVISMTTSSIF